ncbi:hypothetical protein T07_7580 [Trichinella nelsoni]|uniref:Uncharacterized protein n=1 Tax=Trichinella nelsoni TaxID=6336 RepID=A0A0V0RLY8_9BILA|nr:hypothetical protein T07_7580 [Trichinella nelsoni]
MIHFSPFFETVVCEKCTVSSFPSVEDTVGEVRSSFYFFVAEIASWFLSHFITMNPLHQFYRSFSFFSSN